MRLNRKIIAIEDELCNGCGQCIPNCAEGALELVEGKVRLIGERFCDGLGACLGECPTGALQIVEREADDFDEAAVEELLKQKENNREATEEEKMECGCPSARIVTIQVATPCQQANMPKIQAEKSRASSLSHWPIQIRLVPPTAPFLKNADLLVAADCVPFAYAHFHDELLAGRALMIGCPKFDDPKSYIDKFKEIFKVAGLKSLTLAMMEVPCCGNLRMIIKEALQKAAQQIPINEVVVSTRGEIRKHA